MRVEGGPIQRRNSCKSCSWYETRRKERDKSCRQVFNFSTSLVARIHYDNDVGAESSLWKVCTGKYLI